MPSPDTPCTVRELIAFLKKQPPDMGVLYMAYSDYNALSVDDIQVVQAVPQSGYHMRSHPTMSDANKDKEATFVIFPGN